MAVQFFTLPDVEISKSIEREREPTAIASNADGKFVLGCLDGSVERFRSDEFNTSEELLKCESEISRIHWIGSHILVVAAKDSSIQIYNTDSNKIFNTKSVPHSGRVRNASMDPSGEFVVTTGSEGGLHLYKFKTDSTDLQFVAKSKVIAKPLNED